MRLSAGPGHLEANRRYKRRRGSVHKKMGQHGPPDRPQEETSHGGTGAARPGTHRGQRSAKKCRPGSRVALGSVKCCGGNAVLCGFVRGWPAKTLGAAIAAPSDVI